MESGKMFLVALVSVISTYAAVTAWPAVKELFNPLNGSAVASTAPPPTVTPPVTPAVSSRSVVRSATQSMPVASPSVQHAAASSFSTPRLSTIPWTKTDLKYAKRSVVMRARPGGEALKAVSLNKAGLTILRGTRLMPVKYKGEWVMVQAPSAVIGWVHSRELTDERPAEHDHFALQAEE